MAMGEEGSEIRELDRDYRLRILTELRKHPHPLTHQSDSLYNIVNGQVVSETNVNVQDAVEIGQDTRTSFASSLPGGFHHPLKKTLETMQVLKRGVKIKGKTVYDLETVFHLPRSLTSTAASENGARQCARDYWECTHFREATQSQLQMEEERCPPCKYSLKRISTNLIQFCGRTVLLGETCSQPTLLLSVPQLSERKHLVECYQA